MKIWKIAQNDPKYYGDLNDHSGNHDYEPDWDYDIDAKPPKKIMKAFEIAANEIASKHMGVFKGIFARFRIEFVKMGTGELARFISGTCSKPVIVIDLRKCSKVQRELKNDYTIQQVAMTTLMHELKHAAQEAEGRDGEMSQEEMEDDAEEFAQRFR